VTTGIRGLGMAKRTRDLAKRGTGGVTGGNGQVIRLAGPVVPARSGSLAHRVAPAHLACRIGARAQTGERNEHAEVRGHTEAVWECVGSVDLWLTGPGMTLAQY
jgi:hypothetical protein